jgi:hypothetical protein
MTSQEFLIWFQGFSTGVVEPTKAQWEIVQKKLEEVKDGPVSLPSKWTSTNTWENLDKGNKTLLHD